MKKNQVRKDIEAIVAAVEKNAERIRLVTMNTTKGEMSRRIFQQGQATDSQIGGYKPSTRRFRERAGRQTSRVDLELSGTLRGALQVGKSEGRSVIGIAERKEPKVRAEKGRLKITGLSDFSTSDNAIEQEKIFNKEIFAPSEQELKNSEKIIIKELNIVVRSALK